ncbi:Fasciclin domain-containing protein [Bacteroides luti]|uniref:Fasciclin domain-containing protein n=1 Tax=Bacteroides luti TaxID=1297750 RepID=A0A1M5F0R8_9BACE|nr:fasciclin domain-containing protein [Bacteroides luti]SHF85133.1 Fasciclin domain-containing protein [Bacteroides luti]
MKQENYYLKRGSCFSLKKQKSFYIGCFKSIGVKDSVIKYGIKKLLLFSILVLFFGSCSKDFDSYYDRPSWLEDPIYQTLQSEGRFSNYLECVDKTLYSQVLKGSGNYTVFAPNDEAFAKFLKEKGYASVKDIPKSVANQIVSYSLVYNKYALEHLGDVLTTSQWSAGASYKKRTPYYKTIYKENVNGKTEWVIDANAHNGTFSTEVHNYKYLPILTNSYFTNNHLSSSDYNTFFSTNFSGQNVLSGEIVKSDLYSENGVIHEVNSVSLPLNNFDEMLKNDNYSAFKALLDHKTSDGSYQFAKYTQTNTFTEYYKTLYPDSNIVDLYVKAYPSLPFSPNVELYSGVSGASDEGDGYTMFVPSNEAVNEFVQNKLLKYAKSISELPTATLTYFLKAHMSDGIIWPSQYTTAQNANSEFFNEQGASGKTFNESGIIEKKMASNGFFYGIDHVIKSGYFETVYSEILLNPAYSWLNIALTGLYANDLYTDFLKSPLSGYTEENYTILLPSDELLKRDGFAYDVTQSAVGDRFSNSSIKSGTALDRLKRLIRMCVFKRIKNNDINSAIVDFNGNSSIGYDGFGYAVNDYGDMIRFKNGKVQAVGNILDSEWVTITPIATLNNGQVFAIDKLLEYSPRNSNPAAAAGWEDQSITTFVANYFAANPAQTSEFKKYWDKVLSVVSPSINASGYYTILIPTNEQVNAAVAAGNLPALANVVVTKDKEWAQAVNFVSSQILSGTVYSDDGLSRFIPGNYVTSKCATLYKVNDSSADLVGVKTYAEATKVNGQLVFQAKNIEEGSNILVKGIGTSGVIRGVNNSNVMGPRAVIHLVDGYLTFKVNSTN